MRPRDPHCNFLQIMFDIRSQTWIHQPACGGDLLQL
jgi:hypothetical protein